jgi:hypothetical protein
MTALALSRVFLALVIALSVAALVAPIGIGVA